MTLAGPRRCAWARNPRSIDYHDREWGVPLREDRKLFEFLVLEGAQAGLSWATILYAFMQAVGMVNDHTADCFRYRTLRK